MRRLQVRSGARLDMLVGTVPIDDNEMLSVNKVQFMQFVLLDDHAQEAVKIQMPVRTYRPRGANGLITAGPVLDGTDLTIDQLLLIPEFQEELSDGC